MSVGREQFGSKLGFVLAAAGSAVGIGNMVGFPVAAAKNGGGAFLLIYALFVVFLCLPVMIAEMTVGRHTNKDPLGAYKTLSPNNLGWKLAGLLAVITPYMIAVFYTVITVWLFGYLFQILNGNLDQLADASTFGVFINSSDIFVYMVAVIAVVYFILVGGVKNGIEKAAKILMPTLFVMLLMLVVFVLSLDNAFAGVSYYIVPDFSKITAQVINSALSQAFFSLSLGMGIMVTYGSYLSRENAISGSAKMVAVTDTMVAFIAGLLIIPAVFSFNPNTNTESLSDSSVGLIFTFLPQIFLALQDSIGYVGASFVAASFFLLVFFAAITSLVSIAEVPVAAVMQERQVSRKRALAVVGMAIIIVSVLAAMSFGLLSWATEFTHYAGQSRSLFDVLVDVFYDTILPFNGLLICLFVVYKWKTTQFNNEIAEGDPSYKSSWFEKYVSFSLATIIPLVLLIVFVNTVALKFFGISLFL